MNIEPLLKLIAHGSASHGQIFFENMCLSIAEICGASHVFVGEIGENQTQIHTLAFVENGKIIPNIQYDLKGTPCEHLIAKAICMYGDEVTVKFPQDAFLTENNIKGYAGITVYTHSGETIGVIVTLYTFELKNRDLVQTVLSIFSSRASIEMQNIAKEGALEISQAQLSNAEEKVKQNEELLRLNKEIETQKKELEAALYDLKNTQSQLFHAEKMATLGVITSGVAHEINNPLGAVAAFAANSKQAMEGIVSHLEVYANILNQLDPNTLALLKRFLRIAMNWTKTSTGKEHRIRVRQIQDENTKRTLGLNYDILERLVDLNLDSSFDEFETLYKHKSFIPLFPFIDGLIAIHSADLVSEQAIDRVKKIVYSLRNFSRLQTSNDVQIIDICENIETVLTLYQYQFKQNVTLIKNFESIPKLPCYQEDLMQVWTNLIHNALHAVNFNGEIKISVKDNKDHAEISFEDNGKGIPKEVQDKIFLPFFTTKHSGEGTGLGLDISKRIIEKHKGTIDFISEPGFTKFKVTLPYDLIQIQKSATFIHQN
ncbi:ATP-binding protein [Leptospira sp. 96542]|nr:ATP-binding protein [Leptospira sp. 96542]